MANSVQNVGFFGSPDAQEADVIARRRKLAEALQGQSLEPLPTNQGPLHPLQGMAKLAQALVARRGLQRADEQAKGLAGDVQARRGADMSLLMQALQGRQGTPGGLTEDAAGNVTQADPVGAQTPVQALGQAIPMLGSETQPLALNAMMGAQQRQDQQTFQTQQREDQQTFQAEQARQQQLARLHEREMALRAQEAQAGANRDLQASIARERMALQAQIAQLQASSRTENRAPVAVMGPDGKPVYVQPDQAVGRQPWSPRLGGPMPASAVNTQNDMLEQIGIAGNIQADLAALDQQIASGKLPIGPMSNLMNRGRNLVGMSSPESQNFNTFITTLERLRNDSLRLNKGVQTEGDAQRAWNELMGNINDPQVVRRRLKELQTINQRAANLKRLQVDQMRSNFGAAPMDAEPFANQSAAVTGAPGSDDPLGLRKR